MAPDRVGLGSQTMQRKWREWLSNHLYDYWLENGHYRRLRFMLEDHQTPEYRIAEDARVRATDLPIDLMLGLLSEEPRPGASRKLSGKEEPRA